MLFPQQEEFKFESIQELIEYLNSIFSSSPLYRQEIEVIGDVTHAKYSKRGDLYVELSQRVRSSNYSITIIFSQSAVPYVFKHCRIDSEKELLNKRWKFQGIVNFWKREAKYVVSGSSIIPLGASEIEKKKKEILKKLEKSNLLRKVEHELVELDPIKKIAVITSPTAAGFGDFQKNINHSRFIPIVHLYPAPMQGAETVPGIKKALFAILKSGIDYNVVVIIRGGGSKSDLMYFDDFELGSLIAKFSRKIPILTGIGHEQDSTIPDFVSWKNYSTPTEVSRDIVNQINYFTDTLENLEKNITYSFTNVYSQMENLLSFNTINNIKYYLSKEIINLFRTLNDDQLNFNRKVSQMIESSEKSISLNQLVYIQRFIEYSIKTYNQNIITTTNEIISELKSKFEISERILFSTFQELTKSSPFAAFLNNGVLVKKGEDIIDSVDKLQRKDEVKLIFKDGEADSSIEKIQKW